MIDKIKSLPELYQNVEVNDKLIRKGVRDCQGRWDLIKEYISPHDVIIDIGSYAGWFSQKIAKIYPDSLVISFESDPLLCDIQKWIFKKEGIYNVVVCNYRLSKDDLVKWVNHVDIFDVSLLFSVLHHFPVEDLDDVWQAIKKLSLMQLCDMATNEDEKACGGDSKQKAIDLVTKGIDVNLIGETKSHLSDLKRPLYKVSGLHIRKDLDAFFGVNHHDRHKFEVIGNMINGKHIIKGVNVWNLLHFNIVWPEPKWWQVQATAVYKCLDFKSDVRPWNLLFTSTGLKAIDTQTKFPKGDQAEYKSIKEYGDKSDINKMNRLFSKMKPIEWEKL